MSDEKLKMIFRMCKTVLRGFSFKYDPERDIVRIVDNGKEMEITPREFVRKLSEVFNGE